MAEWTSAVLLVNNGLQVVIEIRLVLGCMQPEKSDFFIKVPDNQIVWMN